MPIFMDRHDLAGMSAEDLAQAHKMDLEIQDQFGVKFMTYWFDDDRKTGFCLIDAPDAETAKSVHAASHGNVPEDVIAVDISAVEAFLGRITTAAHPSNDDVGGQGSAFRAVMFTDIVGSTEMTARLGDEQSVEMVRAHDSIVRRSLKKLNGREIKHTGDGLMASFDETAQSIQCARSIQKDFETFNKSSPEKLGLRIGLDAGEPVSDNSDLFGSTVQMAARLCAIAERDSIYVTNAVRAFAPREVQVIERGSRDLKGFSQPIPVFEVVWSQHETTPGNRNGGIKRFLFQFLGRSS
jgi:class 3 adenylate cyclase